MKPARLSGILCWLLFAGLALVASAAPVDQVHALRAAARWRALEPNPMHGHTGSIGKITTYSNATGQPRFHVVKLEPTGFVVIAADDEVEPVIAFALKGDFIGKAGNPLFDLLLKDTEDRFQRSQADLAARRPSSSTRLRIKSKWGLLTAGSAQTDTATLSSTTSIDDVCVAPLVQSEWNQSLTDSDDISVYNYYTPPYAAGNSNNYVCGCVATALAQIMRYWEWPQSSVGTPSFPITVAGTTEQASLRGGNGSGGPYDWADMPLVPGSGVTTTQCQAIGALTYDAGVANQMDYFEDGENESGAILTSYAIRHTFDYAAAASTSGSLASILTAIRTNLDAGQPVSLAIFDSQGSGHQVVCDGYGYDLSTLYHHINVGWGPSWAGLDNIWYNLPTIAPPQSGYDFDTIATCYFNINPTRTGEIISGRITQSNGTPVAGIVVSLQGAATRTGTTNNQGIYVFPGVPSSKSYTVTPTGTGYEYSPSQAPLSTGSSIDLGNVGDRTADFTAGATGTGPYTVTPSSDSNGAISPNIAQVVSSGSSITFTATPNSNYVVNEWLLNGILAQTGSTTYTLSDITSSDTVEVTFDPAPAEAVMQSPVPSTTLTSSSTTFQWNAGTGNIGYFLYVGSSQGAYDIYNSGDLANTVLSQSVTGIPTDGRTIYVRLWSDTTNGWVYFDYTYTAANSAQSFTITPIAGADGAISPNTPQTISSGNSITFTATPNTGYVVDQWILDGVASQTAATTFVVGNVTSDGTLQVTFTQAPIAAQMQLPTPNSTLTSSSVDFQWNAGTGASGYWLYVGSSQGASDIYNSSSIITNLSADVTGIPTDGRTIYVRLWTAANGGWLYIDYTYTAENISQTYTITPSAGANGSISPNTPQLVNSGSSVSFSATANSGYAVDEWLIDGSEAQEGLNNVTLYDITSSQTLQVTFASVSGLAQLQSPVPGSTLTSSSETFQWSAGSGAQAYSLYVGTSQGAYDIYASGIQGTSTFSESVTGLPTDGSTVYIRIWTEINANWQYIDYTCIAVTNSIAQMLSPAPGSTLSSSAADFQWSADPSSTEYFFYVGSSEYDYDIFDSGSISSDTLSLDVTGLPTDGSAIYATLWSYVEGNWEYNEYTYTAAPSGTFYTVTPSAGADGSISPDTQQSVIDGGNITFNATPDSGYAVSQWLVDGTTAQTGSDSFTLDDVTANATVQVNFSENTPDQPINLSPSNGELNVSMLADFQATPFSESGGAQLASEWLVTRVSDNAVIEDTGADYLDMDSLWGVSLVASTTYTWQVRYEDDNDSWGLYSTPTAFTTGAATYRPDAMIGFSSRALIGANIYSSDGLTEQLDFSVPRAHAKSCYVYVENQGAVTDTLLLHGDPGTATFKVTYYYGGTNETKAVLAGTFKLRNVRPHVKRAIEVRVEPLRGAAPDQQDFVHITASSQSDPSSTDTVLYQVTAE